MTEFSKVSKQIRPLDEQVAAEARALHAILTKPLGSLGRLETLGIQLCAISEKVPPPRPFPAAVAVFAADHGVHVQGVTPWPQEVTAQMVGNFLSGGAAINVLARQAGASVTVVDVGVCSTIDAAPGLLDRKVRFGTADLSVEAAMSLDEAAQALDVGASVGGQLIEEGARCLITGEMGIGNTTASAAVIAALTGRPPAEVTGRGTGIDDPTLERKIAAISRALDRIGNKTDGLTVLAELGGLEIAALAGLIVSGAAARVPILVDGVIANAALLVAESLAPGVGDYCFAGHRSAEPGAAAVLEHLGVEPVLDMGMRLGEGSGACLAWNVLDAAARVMQEMSTFDSAGVSGK